MCDEGKQNLNKFDNVSLVKNGLPGYFLDRLKAGTGNLKMDAEIMEYIKKLRSHYRSK